MVSQKSNLKSFAPPRIALIHALAESVAPINQAFLDLWPQAKLTNLLDDSLSADLAASDRGLDQPMHDRFMALSNYALSTGADGILFTCSAFGACIEAVQTRWPNIPILKPNQAMITEIEAAGFERIGLLASFGPTLASMPGEFSPKLSIQPQLCVGALQALKGADAKRHDAIIVNHALDLKAAGVQALAIAQYSMARAAGLVREATGLPVFTTPESAVREIRTQLRA
jgi:aspartate/glutamate racemase